MPDNQQVEVVIGGLLGSNDPVTLAVTARPPGTSGDFGINPLISGGSSALNLTLGGVTVRLRFRVGNDGGREGWTIDNVRVESSVTALAEELFSDGFDADLPTRVESIRRFAGGGSPAAGRSSPYSGW